MKEISRKVEQEIQAESVRDAALNSAKRYATRSRADSTWRTYESAWTVFKEWCSHAALPALPAEPSTVAMFIASQADDGKAVATLEHRLAAIRLMHLGSGVPSPHNTLAVVEVLRGIRRDRKKQSKHPNRKSPAMDADVKRLVDLLDVSTLRGLRDRAILLYGFAGALRRSEIVGIDVDHISQREKGHLLTIPYSKGDQEGIGQTIGIIAAPDSKYCPVRALEDWVGEARITKGSVFNQIFRSGRVSTRRLSDRFVAELIKDAVYRLKDPRLNYRHFSGHSLRRGFLSSAGQNQADLLKLISQSRHKRMESLLGYVEDESRFDQHAGESLLRSPNVGVANK